jgi:hypothetical protein
VNLRSAVKASGGTLGDVVSLRIYVVAYEADKGPSRDSSHSLMKLGGGNLRYFVAEKYEFAERHIRLQVKRQCLIRRDIGMHSTRYATIEFSECPAQPVSSRGA